MNKKLLQEYFLFETHLHSNDASLCARTSAWQWRDFYRLNFPWVDDIILTNHSHSPGLYDSKIMSGNILLNNYDAIKEPKIHSGLEANILADGNLDIDQQISGKAGWIMAALNPLRVEYGEEKYTNQKATLITRNYIKVIESGIVDVIGHPTANINPKEQEKVDWESIFNSAKKKGVMIELNLLEEIQDWWLKKLAYSGCITSLGSDWHGFYHFRRFKPQINMSKGEEEVWNEVSDNGRGGFDALNTNKKEIYNYMYLSSPLGEQLYNWHSTELIKAINLGLQKRRVINSRGSEFLLNFIKSSKSARRKLISQL